MREGLGARMPAAAALAIASLLWVPAAHAAKLSPRPTAQGTFTDNLTSYDTSRWTKADGWTNGSPFDNAWLADHVTFHDGMMDLRLDNHAALGAPYSSGELRTTGFYGYGCYEAKFRPVAVPGVVTSLFTFAGPYDNGGNGKHNEIDIEFVGRDTSMVQFNFWTNDDAYAANNAIVMTLGFDASQSTHRYGFKWTSGGVGWYLDGNIVYQVNDSTSNPTPKAADSLQKIMLNLWPVDATASPWAGTFVYPGQPMHALYDWFRYTAGEACEFGPEPKPPPPGDPSIIHVAGLSISISARSTQAIAKVTVVDGLGRAVPGATVTGAWSGVITTGDTSRTTDTNGVATFYSAQSRATGNVGFCVTGVAGGSLYYDQNANLQSCTSITK